MKEIYRKIKKFIQRGKRGWSDEDTWDFDNYLSEVISGGCKHLANNLNSYPNGLTEKKWKEILLSISDNIMGTEKADGMNIKYDDYKELEKRQKEALKLLTKYYLDLWD